MVFLQAVISLLGRSAGKVFSALFGWAVSALFGQTTPRERTMLSVVVAAAAAWPILLFGVVAPKVATLLVAFVPVAKSVPGGAIRIVWIVLSLLVPVVIGTVFAHRAPPRTPPDSRIGKLLRGFQITLALAAAFRMGAATKTKRKADGPPGAGAREGDQGCLEGLRGAA